MQVFTIGYGGRSPAEFLALLQPHGIRTVVDVRLRPDRASMGIWVKAKTPDKGIERWLTEAGLGYQSLIELGNLFRDCPDWQPRYAAVLEASGDVLTQRLLTIPGPLCLLCAEKRASDCHRHAVADFLARRHGATVQHLE